ncbi:MAG: hypothetical protein KAR12_10625 [Methylococcales bacterium]|nr:hypothetical protein [Methylococcales bacterium]
MYTLIKSEIIPLHHAVSENVLSYRQVQLHQFMQLEAALTACQMFNDKQGSRHYVINESGKEYYDGIWIE